MPQLTHTHAHCQISISKLKFNYCLLLALIRLISRTVHLNVASVALSVWYQAWNWWRIVSIVMVWLCDPFHPQVFESGWQRHRNLLLEAVGKVWIWCKYSIVWAVAWFSTFLNVTSNLSTAVICLRSAAVCSHFSSAAVFCLHLESDCSCPLIDLRVAIVHTNQPLR